MRRLFAGVPAIYGFSGPAPVGATAAALLNRYFAPGAQHEIASGRPSSRLLGAFSRNSMVSIPGLTERDPRMANRHQVCQFYDERQGVAQKLLKVHAMMKRDMGEARRFFERIEDLLESVPEEEKRSNAFTLALAQISTDDA